MNVAVIASTVTQLAQLGVVAFGIHSARIFLIHWLDKRGPALDFPERRTTEQIRQDEEVL